MLSNIIIDSLTFSPRFCIQGKRSQMDSCRIDFDAVHLLVAAAGCIELLELDWAAVIRFRSLVAAEAPKQSPVPAAACFAASASISDTVFTFPIPRTLEPPTLAVAAVAPFS